MGTDSTDKKIPPLAEFLILCYNDISKVFHWSITTLSEVEILTNKKQKASQK
jgi:hypothetical protein